jgi:hypothetical protein
MWGKIIFGERGAEANFSSSDGSVAAFLGFDR